MKSLPHPLLDSLEIFAYLTTTSSRVPFYRTLMRTFYLAHRDSYDRYLNEIFLCRAIREQLDPHYTIEECFKDLDFLEEHGNITHIVDEQRPIHSIAEFTQRARLYQATNDAIAIEQLLDILYFSTHDRVKTLHKETLEEIYHLVSQLDTLLAPPATSPGQMIDEHQREQIAQIWQHVFDLWGQLSKDASDYVASLTQAARQRQDEHIDHFLKFKETTLYYIQHIAQALGEFAPAIHSIVEDWHPEGKIQLLVESIIEQQQRTTYTEHSAFQQEKAALRVEQQIHRFHAWFADTGQQTLFRYKASEAVQQVVRRASLLIWARRSSFHLSQSLQECAEHLAAEPSVEKARQLYTVAFSQAPSTLYSQALYGMPEWQRHRETNPWEEPVPSDLHVRTLGNREHHIRQREQPLRDTREHVRRLQLAQQEEDEQQVACFHALFRPPFLDLGALPVLEEQSRDLLLDVIDECLLDAHHHYATNRGITLYLQNPEEPHWITITCTDGALHIPRYQFVLEQER